MDRSTNNLEEIREFLVTMVAERLSLPAAAVRTDSAFFTLGVTSMLSDEIMVTLGRHYNNLSPTLLFEYPSIDKLASYLQSKGMHAAEITTSSATINAAGDPTDQVASSGLKVDEAGVQQQTPAIQAYKNGSSQDIGCGYDIAVIGMSGRFPKAENTAQLWHRLIDNVDCIEEIPASRWNVYDYVSSDKTKRDAIFAKWGGFIDGIEYFDPLFFQISHREAEHMDPQQKLFLQCCWEAMEDAGYANSTVRESYRTGIYAGVTWNEFSVVSQNVALAEKSYAGSGSLYWGIPNRVSYFMDLRGPSVAIDTACSSSLVAVHDACQSILSQECDIAIAGGVNLNLHPAKYQFLSQNHFLSSDGRCRSFGDGGDGYVPAEGVCAVLLKPVAKALADGDYIYGVIRGSAVNHGGKVTGYTVPNPQAHTDVIVDAMTRAGVSADQISYVETHGTGTELGDPIEIRGLTNAYEVSTDVKNYCAIGSLKSNVGHMEAAAGVAGLIKTLLCMNHRELPASLHCAVENDKLCLKSTPFYLVKSNTAWAAADGKDPLVAGVSSFGAGGSNAHIVVQSAPNADYVNAHGIADKPKSNCWPVVLSAHSVSQLLLSIERLSEFCQQLPGNVTRPDAYTLENISHSLIVGREHLPEKLVFIAASIEELVGLMQRVTTTQDLAARIVCDVHLESGSNGFEQLEELKLWSEQWVNDPTDAVMDWINPNGCRVPLPVYPFLRERSWLTPGYPLVTNVDNSSISAIHPLVDANVSTLDRQRFVKNFTLSEFVLRDHYVNNVPVVPGVCHLEIATAAARLAVEHGDLSLRDVWFSNVIDVDDARQVAIEFYPTADDVHYEIVDANDGTRFSHGTVLTRSVAQTEAVARSIDPDVVSKDMERPWSIDAVYDKFVATGIVQKDSFRVLQDIAFSKDQAISTLALPDHLVAEFEQFTLHPSLLDGAVQTAMMHVQYLSGRDLKILPFHFDQVRALKALTATAYVQCTVKNENNKQFDLTIYDENGELAVELDGFMLRNMRDPVAVDSSVEGFYVPQWVDTDWVNASSSPQAVLLLGSAQSNEKALRSLSGRVDQVTRVDIGRPQVAVLDDRLEVDLNCPEQLDALLLELESRQQLPDRVLFFANRMSFGEKGAETSILPTAFATGLFRLCQLLIKKSRTLDITLVADRDGNADAAIRRGSAGLFRTLSLEKAGFTGRVITLDGAIDCDNDGIDDDTLARVLDESFSDSDDIDVQFTGTARQVRRFASADIDLFESIDNPLRDNGCYLITGGMGGLGLVFAQYLAKNYRANLYLVGRSAKSDSHRRIIQELEGPGASVAYHSANVADLNQMQALVSAIEADGRTLNGVIHAAGVLRDGLVYNKSIDVFREVLQPKVDGTIALDLATQSTPLDFFVCFSSATSVLGNLGQSDYGFANAFQDYFAVARQSLVATGQRCGHSISINWPYWKDGGMQLSDKQEQALADSLGLSPLNTDSGIQAFEQALRSDVQQIAVLLGDKAIIEKRLFHNNDVAIEVDGSDEVTKNSTTMAASDKELHGAVAGYLRNLFSTELKIPADRISMNGQFESYGFDSIVMIDLIEVMENKFDSLPKTLFFEHQTLSELVDYFIEHHRSTFTIEQPVGVATRKQIDIPARKLDQKAKASPATGRFKVNPELTRTAEPARSTVGDAVAIVGLAGRYPKANSIDEFWENLKAGRDCVTEVPPQRWDIDSLYQSGAAVEGKSYSKWGGFLDDADKFDPLYFNISPKEAALMDPQERLFLETVAQTIANAGYTPNTIAQETENGLQPVGVYVGVMWGDYQLFGVESEDPESWQTPHAFYWAVANRVSYYFNFNGPSLAIDTACSSSLTALHLACEAIRRGEIGAAIAGGVNLSLHPNKYNLLSQMQFLSSDGKCRSFGDNGDGYVPGEGVGAVLLKSLQQAELDGDHIYGVIKGSSVNHGGKTSGFTVPNPKLQSSLICSALQTASVDPRHISYFEAHGTGTSLGDPIELNGASNAFNQSDQQYCAIGSVKSNIGHLEAAAGTAALTKVLLQMKHRQLVPSLHSDPINPNLSFEQTPFRVQQSLAPWTRPVLTGDEGESVEIPRLAGISSFGAGGSNAHLVVEEYIPPLVATDQGHRDCLIVLSARTAAALVETATRLETFLRTNSHVSIGDVAYTLQLGRVAHEHRAAIVAASVEDLVVRLATFIADDSNDPAIYTDDRAQQTSLGTLLTEDQDAQEIVSNWLRRRNFGALATAWVGGVNVHWQDLYHGDDSKCRRVPLPGIVFSRERYWIKPVRSGKVVNALTDLLDENISDLERIAYRKHFDVSDAYISQHTVGSRNVLPATVSLEMALQASAIADAGRAPTCLSNVVWSEPVFARSRSEDGIDVDIDLIPAGGKTAFEAGQWFDGKFHIHAQGQIGYNELRKRERFDVETVNKRCKPLDVNDFANSLRQVGFEFGDNFDVFDSIEINDDEALARIRLPEIRAGKTSTRTLHPILLDGVLRTSLAVASGSSSGKWARVPVAIERLEIHAPLPQETVHVHARARSRSEAADGGAQIYDISAFSQNGDVLITVAGLKLVAMLGLSGKTTTDTSELSDPTLSTTSKQGDGEEAASRKSQDTVIQGVELYLKGLLSRVTDLDVEKIDSDVALDTYGIDSVMIVSLNESMEQTFGDLPATVLFEYQKISSLAKYLCSEFPVQCEALFADAEHAVTNAPPASKSMARDSKRLSGSKLTSIRNRRARRGGSDDIAIIGLSGQFPQSSSIEQLWNNLKNGRDCIEEIPESRWNWREKYVEGVAPLGKINGKWGGFFEEFDAFDPRFFNLPPSQARSMDPQERLFLQVVWSCIEDAGYTPADLKEQLRDDMEIGVFAGSMWNHYSHVGLDASLRGDPTMTYGWDASIANRISYFFDFHGPSLMVDTACSSALMSIHLACESIHRGECLLAIAGGVNLTIHPYKYETLSQMQMLSSDGRCRSFGEGGDGYVPGEGVGAVLLKPLSQARDDGDNIHAVIKGSAVSHDGKTNGFTVPNPVAQASGLRRLFERSDVDPASVTYFEAHGTGTALGDPVEVSALTEAFSGGQARGADCALGSIKSNIGHLEGAAGVAALAKVVLQLKHRSIVPSLHSQELNKNIDFQKTPFVVPQECSEWVNADSQHPRRAGIGSLGAGGTNAYLLVQEYVDELPTASVETPQLIVLSARTPERLGQVCSDFERFLEVSSSLPALSDMAYTLQVGRLHHESRFATVTSSITELKTRLRQFLNDQWPIESCWKGECPDAAKSQAPHARAGTEQLTEADYEVVDLGALARHWVAGDSVCWPSSAQAEAPRRVSLPTYPFLKERYWPEVKRGAGQPQVRWLAETISENISTFEEQKFAHTFTKTDRFIADHVLDGKRIVPAAAMLTMANTAFSLAGQTSAATMNDVTWHRPATVDDSLSLFIRLTPSDYAATFEIFEPINGEQDKVYCSGTIASHEPGVDLTFPEAGIAGIHERLSAVDALSRDDIYQRFSENDYQYGVSLRVLDVVSVGVGNVVARMSKNPAAGTQLSEESRQIAVLDGALQAAFFALSPKQKAQGLVPHRLGSLHTYAPVGERCFVNTQLATQPDGSYQLAIDVVNDSGELAYQMREVSIAPMPRDMYGSSTVSASTAHSQLQVEADAREVNPLKVNRAEVTAYLKRLISTVTEIPVAQIRDDALWEEYGIDSIIVMNLNMLLNERYPQLPSTLFFEYESVSQLAQHILSLGPSGSDQPDAIDRPGLPAVQSNAEPSNALTQDVYIVEPKFIREELVAGTTGAAADAAILFFGKIDARVTFTRGDHVFVEWVDDFKITDDHHFGINPQRPEHFNRLISILGDRQVLPDRIVWLATSDDDLGDVGQQSDTLLMTASRLRAGVLALRYLIQALSAHKTGMQTRIGVLLHQQNGQSAIEYSAIAGFATALPDVNSKLIVGCIEVNQAHALSDGQLISELGAEEFIAGRYIRYHGEQRLVRRLMFCSSDDAEAGDHFATAEQGVYVVTGGLGGLGRIFAEYIGQRAQKSGHRITLVLLGRSQQTAQTEAQLSALECGRARVVYIRCDVTDAIAVDEVLEGVRATHGAIKGLFHLAGSAGSASVVDASDEAFATPLAAKVNGARVLDLATRNDSLDYFILFSSITSEIGDFGAGSYAYANRYLDDFAVQRASWCERGRRQGLTLSIAWPLWSGDGMQMDDALIQSVLKRTGLTVLDAALGLSLFERCIATARSQLIVAGGEKSDIEPLLDIATADGQSAGLPVPTKAQHQCVCDYLIKALVSCLELDESTLSSTTLLTGLNLDAIDSMRVAAKISADLGEFPESLLFRPFTIATLSDVLIHDYQNTVTSIAGFNADSSAQKKLPANSGIKLLKSQGDAVATVNPRSTIGSRQSAPRNRFSRRHPQRADQIAIVGLAGRYPKADNVEQFWSNLRAGLDAITEVPAERWDHQRYYNQDRNNKGSAYAKWGGFVNGIQQFDAAFFNISPREAQTMDPQERLFLQTAWESLEDAGYTRGSVSQYNVGVFVGAMWSQYQLIDVDEQQQSIGRPTSSFASIANRVSYFFDFNGPSVSLDTMCSSSLVAINSACQSIAAGDCNMALVGGVNLTPHPNKYLLLSQGQFLSSDGRCRAFGEGGDGYVPGEGCGVVVLKPLADAEHDGDHIYGVIASSGVGHGGKTKNYTVPSPAAQARVISQALARANWSPESIQYIEAHGTGTSLGDPIEIAGLEKAFGDGVDQGSCAIGSVKSNIGHLESAAGMAGLTKILLQLKHGELAPSLHADICNPNIDFDKSSFRVIKQPEPWPRPTVSHKTSSALRRAGLSSFGAGGTNAHLLVEEHQPKQRANKAEGDVVWPLLFVLSAPSRERLEKYVDRFIESIDERLLHNGLSDDRTALIDYVYTLQVGREPMSWRLAVSVDSFSDLAEKLSQYKKDPDNNQVSIGCVEQAQDMDALIDAQTRHALVRKLIDQENFADLTALWLTSQRFNWVDCVQYLYGGFDPRRMSLPTMPFETKDYWVSTAPDEVSDIQVQSAMHPFIDSNVSTLNEQQYRKVFRADEFYLRDHIIDYGRSRCILPGVAYLEMAYVAAREADCIDAQRCVLTDVMWIKPLEVDGADGCDSADSEVITYTRLVEQGQSLGFEVVSINDDGEQTVHANGAYASATTNDIGEHIDIDRLLALAVSRIENEQVYEQLRSMGYRYGPAFRTTDFVCSLPNAALSRLTLPHSMIAQASQFHLHPSLLDAALRTCLAIGQRGYDPSRGAMVPFAMSRMEIMGPLTASCFVYAEEIQNRSDESSKVQHYNLQVADENGRVIIRIEDFVARSLDSDKAVVGNFEYHWVEELAASDLTKASDVRPTLLIAGGDSARFLLDRQTRQVDVLGEKIVFATCGDAFAINGDGSIVFNPAEELHHQKLVTELIGRGVLPDRIIYVSDALASKVDLGSGTPVEIEFTAAMNDAVGESLGLLQSLFKQYNEHARGKTVRCLVAYANADDISCCLHRSISGFARSLLSVNHRFELMTCELPVNDYLGRIDMRLRDELERSSVAGLEIAYRDGRRLVRKLKPASIESAEPGSTTGPRQGGVYLITGGLGRLGLVFAKHLAQKYDAKLVLSGRSELSAEKHRELEILTTAGAEVIYEQTDVASRDDVQEMVAAGRQKFGRLDGVIHCAGVADERSVAQTTVAQFTAAMAAKVHGVVALDLATQSDDLDFFVSFSSISSVLGDFGACSYAAANRFLDAYMEQRARRCDRGEAFGQSLTINWPLWDAGGLDIPENEQAVFAYSGMQPLLDSIGIEVFEQALHSGLCQVVSTFGNQQKIRRALKVEPGVVELRQPSSERPGSIGIDVDSPVASGSTVPEIDSGSVGSQVEQIEWASDSVIRYLTKILCDVTRMQPCDVGRDKSFESFGLDSVMLMEMHDRISADIADLPKTAIFEYDTVLDLARYLDQSHHDSLSVLFGVDQVTASGCTGAEGTKAVQPQTEKSVTNPIRYSASGSIKPRKIGHHSSDKRIAVIGMAGEFPGSPTLKEFWNNIDKANNCTRVVQPDRWKSSRIGYTKDSKTGEINDAKWGGFLENAHAFDHQFFGMTSDQAAQLDPQLRVMLMTAWAALEDSAYTSRDVSDANVGVYLGAMNHDYTWVAAEHYFNTGKYVGPGSFVSDLANRVSSLMDFRGPSLTVESACTSSVAAVHLARMALLAGECNMALVGGVNLSLHPSKYLMLDEMNVLSRDGCERTFDASANGLVPGEGVGAVILKRHADAISDGDNIHAVVNATAISHSGAGAGQNIPSLSRMAQTVRHCIDEANVEPGDIGYLESHGTGTELGDPIEIKALSNAIKGETALRNSCAIGTKANFGHLEAASGICSLIKSILCMQHETLVPCANVERVNPAINLDESPFYILDQSVPWRRNKRGTRIAGINSFGMGGANGFMIVESADKSPDRRGLQQATESNQVLIFSAQSQDQLKRYVRVAAEYVQSNEDICLNDAAYTTQTGRLPLKYRVAFVVSSFDEFVSHAERFVAGDKEISANRVFTGVAAGERKLARILDDDHGKAFVNSLIKDANTEKLSELWANGIYVPWTELHVGRAARRVSMPTYPFIRQDCQLTTAESDGSQIQTVEVPMEATPNQDVAIGKPASWFVATPSHQVTTQHKSIEQSDNYWKDTLLDKYSDWPRLCKDKFVEPQIASVSVDRTVVAKAQQLTQTLSVEAEALILAAWSTLCSRYLRSKETAITLVDYRKLENPEQGIDEQPQSPFVISTKIRGATEDWLQLIDANLREHRTFGDAESYFKSQGTASAQVCETLIRLVDGVDSLSAGAAESDCAESAQSLAYALTLNVAMSTNSMNLGLCTRRDLNTDKSLKTILDHFVVLLQGIVEEPQRSPAALSMRTDEEKYQRFWRSLERMES